MRNSTLKPISQKQAKRLIIAKKVIDQLRLLCNNKSEISGSEPDWQSGYLVEPHHICGRQGNNLFNPFRILMCIRAEHETIHKTNSRKHKLELLAFIKPIRLAQGFKEDDYE